MKIGFIGSGKVGCSIGKYLSNSENVQLVGYFSRNYENAVLSANFTSSKAFKSIDEIVASSDTLFIAVNDDNIRTVWDCIDKTKLENKIVCHFSGSLSSAVFSDSKYGAFCSIHPMMAFSDKYNSYKNLNNAGFSIEGDEIAVKAIKTLFEKMGNEVVRINSEDKIKYHTGASVLSNMVVAVLDMGYSLLEECGFSREQAIAFTKTLVSGNMKSVIENGTQKALTGPIERNDIGTVEKHISVLDKKRLEIYIPLARKLTEIASEKNKEKEYAQLKNILEKQYRSLKCRCYGGQNEHCNNIQKC